MCYEIGYTAGVPEAVCHGWARMPEDVKVDYDDCRPNWVRIMARVEPRRRFVP